MDVQKSKQVGRVRTSRAIEFGILGGIIGAIVMGGIASMMPVNGAPFFVAAAMMMRIAGGTAVAAGWTLHIITGLIVGAIFGVVTSKVSKLGITRIGRGLGLGAAAGIVVWIVLFMPMMAALMPSLMSMGTIVVGSFVAHVIYGLVLGGVVAGLSSRTTKAYTCEACGASFSGQEELVHHGKVHMNTAQPQPQQPQQNKCNACGGTFNSDLELMEHAKKAHPMATR
jgi:uncharacterized membrane protein YagU involved in acid resistance